MQREEGAQERSTLTPLMVYHKYVLIGKEANHPQRRSHAKF